jgi:aminoglycoside phosphotransferase
MTLELLDDIQNYRKLFMDANFWQPYVATVMETVRLPCNDIRGGIPGTYPTFIVDDTYVVKFFGRLFDGEKSHHVELVASQLLKGQKNFPVPALLAQGQLFEDDLHWSWPYLVFEYLDGINISEAWDNLPLEEKQAVSKEMGYRVRALHAISLEENTYFIPTWENYRGFLKTQRSNLLAKKKNTGWLPSHLWKQLEDFLLPVDQLVDPETGPHFIHADLTHDHLLGKVKNGKWHTLGLIDFGDAMVGNLYYELIALHLDLFQGDRKLLGIFLKNYGYVEETPGSFSIRAMNMTLLHQFGEDIITDLFYRNPYLKKLRTFEELAEEIWGIN